MNNGSSTWKWIFTKTTLTKVALLVLVFVLFPLTAMANGSLHGIWKDARVDTWSPSNADELDAVEKLIVDELYGRRAEKLANRWQELGFTRSRVEYNGLNFVVVTETEDQRLGRAMLVFADEDGRLFLQTPHSRSDLHTGEITLKMMEEGGYTAGIWNLAPRRYEWAGEKKTADMGKISESYFTAFSRAVAEVHPEGAHLQMHGFSQGKRKTKSARSARIIVSSGTDEAEKKAYRLAICLEKFYPGDVRLYPDNVSELGGTRNISGATLRASNAHGFIHLELAKALRDELRKSASTRARLTGCVKSVF